MLKNNYLIPDWPAPENIKCVVTKRNVSNLALHVNDDPEKVHLNRQAVQTDIKLNSIQWLQQVHGTDVVVSKALVENPAPHGDALYTTKKEHGCAVLTADCLPVFFCNRGGTEVAVAHAGWRGLINGVLLNTLETFNAAPDDIFVWLGPAIGPCHFEIGEEVRQLFLNINHDVDFRLAFSKSKKPGKWMADLYQLAKLMLNDKGVTNIYGGGQCTYCKESEYFSYRRNKNTGRFASIIWIS